MKLGIDLIKENINVFGNKRVGLITNHTGLNKDFESTIDILNNNTNLTTLFAPEHGIRGDIQAGEKLGTYKDEKTGLTVYSLYGETKKPTKEMLANVDILCFDIQDVGARYYTYIYTMAYAMIAAKENNIEFVVFDRPNPLGGNITEGNILNVNYRSFVGYYPILQRHGLTVGELASLFNKEYNIGAKLTVIKMDGWNRKSTFFDLDLNWVLPSPNLPTIESTFEYLITCIFEGTNVSEGRGTSKPFSFIGAPWLKSNLIIQKLNELKITGVKFRETFFTPTFSKHVNELCYGIEIYVTDFNSYQPVILSMILLKLIQDNHDEFEFRQPWSVGNEPMINLLVGDNFIKEGTKTIKEIQELFINDKIIFDNIRKEYLLYD